MTPESKIAAKELADALKGGDNVRVVAAWALGQVEPDAKSAVPSLISVGIDNDRKFKLERWRNRQTLVRSNPFEW